MKQKREQTYTLAEIRAVWKKFRRDFIYKALIRGEWKLVSTVAEGKAEGATKIDMKRVRDVVDFPDYLRAVVTK